MVGAGVVAGHEVDVAAVAGAAVVADRVEPGGAAGAVGRPACGVAEVAMGVEAQDIGVDGVAGYVRADGAEVDIAAVAERAVVAGAVEAAGSAGVVGGKGGEGFAGAPLRDQRLQGFGAVGLGFDPGFDGKGVGEGQISEGFGAVVLLPLVSWGHGYLLAWVCPAVSP